MSIDLFLISVMMFRSYFKLSMLPMSGLSYFQYSLVSLMIKFSSFVAISFNELPKISNHSLTFSQVFCFTSLQSTRIKQFLTSSEIFLVSFLYALNKRMFFSISVVDQFLSIAFCNLVISFLSNRFLTFIFCSQPLEKRLNFSITQLLDWTMSQFKLVMTGFKFTSSQKV